MITDVADYFAKGCGRCDRFATPDCSTRQWAGGLEALRRLCIEAGLTETVKWGHPCYMHAGRNIAIIGAFRGDFRLSFFNAALMKDPEGVLEKQGPNTRHADMIRFRDNAQVKALEPVIRAYLAEAMGYAEAGIKPAREDHALELPEELAEALDHDPELAEAFHALTPGRQKSYVINIGSAKASATRIARIGKFRPKILAGKGAMER
ncbi:YdeI/OmpD-associated family protein [Glycocaulis sp.]|uniref:YdeI/OmpD-associated family protein n=1 Tax=Glycocaulis sp. TaxID=1969725 RepID=UPI003D1EB307